MPYVLLKWPDSIRVVQAEVAFSGSDIPTQTLQTQTNDEFGVAQLAALHAALRRLYEGGDEQFELHGGDGAFRLTIAKTGENTELKGAIGIPYLRDRTMGQLANGDGFLFAGYSRFSFPLNRQAIVRASAEISSLLDHLDALGLG